MATKVQPARGDLYEADFHAWAQRQAELLRAGRLGELDVLNLAEEVEDLSRRERDALESRLEVLLVHLLKWRHQPARRGVSWESTIAEQRYRVAKLLRESPSLRPRLPDLLAGAYPAARLAASAETGMPAATFPGTCPFALDDVLADGWLP